MSGGRAPVRPCRLLLPAAAVALGLLGPAASSQAQTDRAHRKGSDWPSFLGPTGDSKSAEQGIRTDWSQGLPMVWHGPVGEGYSMPVVARGRLLLFDRHGDRARLTALVAETGEELWRSEYPTDYVDDFGYSGGPRASPVIDGDLVCTHGAAGRVRCHRLEDGELLWEVDTFARYGVRKNFFGVGASPIVEGDLLLVAVGGSPPSSPDVYSGAAQPNGSAIVAFDKRTGRERYRLGDDLASYSTPRVVSLGGRRLGLYFGRSGLLAFEPAGGRVELQFPWRAAKLYSVNASVPVVVGATVFVTESYGAGGAMLEIAPEGKGGSASYEVLWQDQGRTQSIASHWSTPVHHDGYLYGSSGEKSGSAELRCVEHATGRVVWRQPGLRRATLLYVDRHFVVLGEYGELLLIAASPQGFRPLGELRPEAEVDGRLRPLLRHPAWAAPILARGLLYVRGSDHLVSLELIPQ